jgi:lipopolysaccharide/colanic/teichoic acid biosynthesis glycosyltransferase
LPNARQGVTGVLKRLFDVVVSGLSIVVLAPLLFAVAAAVRISSPGPVIFAQRRVGRNFHPFQIYKFRTMYVDAPARGGQLTVGTSDPRITPVGRFLRGTKLDELPQLWNVLQGDMSLVGPRPEVPKYVEMFRGDYAEILRVRPGITDPASLKYRREADQLASAGDPEAEYVERILPDKIAISKHYLRTSSLLADAGILLRTLFRF